MPMGVRAAWIAVAAGLAACSATGTVATTGGTSSGGSTTGGGTSSSGGTTGGMPGAPYTLKPFDRTHISSTIEPNVRQADATIDFHDGPFASVQLTIDLESPCYPFSKWDGGVLPPWPVNCDAFDRNFEFSLDDPGPDGGAPGLELERAITPFGGPLHLVVDVTDVANARPGVHQLRVTIPTYSDPNGQLSGSNGGWYVTASIDATPGPDPRSVLGVVSLFYGDVVAGPPVAPVSFDVPAGTKHGRLYYRVTGHGGTDATGDSACIGPAEEFCKREHQVFLDGASIADLTPWRSDCASLCTTTQGGPFGSYCLENPCGSPGSVRAPRANWCPGSETPPIIWSPAALAVPGNHSVNWTVAHVASGGLWRTSITYVAYGK
jgi:Peptide-N-glycosidase F, C terminal